MSDASTPLPASLPPYATRDRLAISFVGLRQAAREELKRRRAEQPRWATTGGAAVILATLVGLSWGQSRLMESALPTAFAGVLFLLLGLSGRMTWVVYGLLVWWLARLNTFPQDFWLISAETLCLFAGASLGSQLALKQVQLEAAIRKDPLTGVANRLALREQLQTEINRCRRFDRCLTVLVMDCDNFKPLNDRAGHLAGDQTLMAIADVLRSTVRTYDMVCRWGGDEFVVLLPETSADEVTSITDRLWLELRARARPFGEALDFSGGVVTWDGGQDLSADELLDQADRCLYRAKQAGGGQVVASVIRSPHDSQTPLPATI